MFHIRAYLIASFVEGNPHLFYTKNPEGGKLYCPYDNNGGERYITLQCNDGVTLHLPPSIPMEAVTHYTASDTYEGKKRPDGIYQLGFANAHVKSRIHTDVDGKVTYTDQQWTFESTSVKDLFDLHTAILEGSISPRHNGDAPYQPKLVIYGFKGLWREFKRLVSRTVERKLRNVSAWMRRRLRRQKIVA